MTADIRNHVTRKTFGNIRKYSAIFGDYIADDNELQKENYEIQTFAKVRSD